MHSLLRRVVGIGIVGLIVLGGVVAWRSRGAARHAAAKDRATAACRVYRAEPAHVNANVCRAYDEFGPHAVDIFRRAEKKLDDALASLASGDLRSAENAIASAVSSVDELGRFGTVISSLMAAKLVDRALDLVGSHPEIERSRALRGANLDVARRPLEGERIHHLWLLAHLDELPNAPPITKGMLADALETDDMAYREMDRAIVVGDVARCQRAAQGVSKTPGGNGVVSIFCDKLPAVVRAGKRLDEARTASP